MVYARKLDIFEQYLIPTNTYATIFIGHSWRRRHHFKARYDSRPGTGLFKRAE